MLPTPSRGALGPPWAPWGGPRGPLGPPRGPLGPPWAPWAPLGPWAPNPLLWAADKFKTLPENRHFGILESKTAHQKVGIWAPGPPRRDPGRNSEPDPGFKVPNGATATHLVTKRCDLGSLGVPGPASTPLGRRGRATSSIDPKLDLDLDISDLGFDQISSYKRGGWGGPLIFPTSRLSLCRRAWPCLAWQQAPSGTGQGHQQEWAGAAAGYWQGRQL